MAIHASPAWRVISATSSRLNTISTRRRVLLFIGKKRLNHEGTKNTKVVYKEAASCSACLRGEILAGPSRVGAWHLPCRLQDRGGGGGEHFFDDGVLALLRAPQAGVQHQAVGQGRLGEKL